MTNPTARARDLGVYSGTTPTGPHNAITDVPGIAVGHTTIRRPPNVHTGVTAIRVADATPHRPVPAGLFAGNGYGKLVGATQVAELGQIESPIVLTATLSAFRAADALVSWLLDRPDCADIGSFNPVVAECNDGYLSDIRSRPVAETHVRQAIDAATDGPVAEGAVGAGTGMVALGFKAGIGTASRIVDVDGMPATVGAMVLANFGGTLRIGARLVPAPDTGNLEPAARHGDPSTSAPSGTAPDAVSSPSGTPTPDDGSCVVLVATDAPLDARQLTRVARRAVFGLGRVGASYSHGSGDYGIAVSTGDGRPPRDAALSPLFAATLDATEETVLNALCAATSVTGHRGRTVPALRDVLD